MKHLTLKKILTFLVLIIFAPFAYCASPIVDVDDDYEQNTEFLANTLEQKNDGGVFEDDDSGRHINIESISSEESFLLHDKKSIDNYEKNNLLYNKDSLLGIKDKPKTRRILDNQKTNKDNPFGYKNDPFVRLILSAKELELKTPYQFKRTYVSPKTKQFLFDFYIDKEFKKSDNSLYHEYFNSIRIKSLPLEEFFRVTVVVTKDTKNYKTYLKGKSIVIEYTAKKNLIKDVKSYRPSKPE
jgi:hypothetical protein